MKKLIILALVCLAQLSQAASKPNVIYIIADDLGYGDLSAYGQNRIHPATGLLVVTKRRCARAAHRATMNRFVPADGHGFAIDLYPRSL